MVLWPETLGPPDLHSPSLPSGVTHSSPSPLTAIGSLLSCKSGHASLCYEMAHWPHCPQGPSGIPGSLKIQPLPPPHHPVRWTGDTAHPLITVPQIHWVIPTPSLRRSCPLPLPLLPNPNSLSFRHLPSSRLGTATSPAPLSPALCIAVVACGSRLPDHSSPASPC